MAWIYLAESEDSAWPCHHGSDLSPIVRRTDSLKLFYCLGCGGVNFLPPQYGTTSPLSYRSCCPDRKLISSTADSPARILALLDAALAWKGAEADCFFTLSGSLATFDRDSFSWKTSQLSLFGGLTEFSWSSLRWGTTVDGLLFQPQKWAPRTSENDGSFWQTPVADDAVERKVGKWNSRGEPKLSAQVLLPTPTATPYGSNQSPSEGAAVRMSLDSMARAGLWPTPTASRGDYQQKDGKRFLKLSGAVKLGTPTAGMKVRSKEFVAGRTPNPMEAAGGALNPVWVEWLMGYQLGWTALEDWATQWFLSARAKRSGGSRESKKATAFDGDELNGKD